MPVTEWDFGYLLTASTPELLTELTYTHSEIATLLESIAYNRTIEQGDPQIKSVRIIEEGRRDAFIEKKYLIIRLIENHASRTD
jgi:hypothetical protein